MNKKNYVVYMHKNKTNGKAYIGITQQEPNRRWKNGLGYKKNKHLYSSIQKYGWDGFEHIILFKNLSEFLAKQYEIYLINCYDATNREKGYNQTIGGEGMLGKKLSEESKQKIREANLGRKTKYTPQGLSSISRAHKGKNNVNAKQVICDGIVYDTIVDMMKACNLSSGAISQWLNGTKTMPEEWYNRGLRFVDVSYGTPIKRTYSKVKPFSKKVSVDGLEFDSIKLCAEYLKANSSTISCYLRGKRKMTKELKERDLKYID